MQAAFELANDSHFEVRLIEDADFLFQSNSGNKCQLVRFECSKLSPCINILEFVEVYINVG